MSDGLERRIAMATEDGDVRTDGAVAGWITRIVEDVRKRDAVRLGEEELAARKTALIRANGQRLLEELRTAVTRDVEAFRREFDGDHAHYVVVEDTQPDGAFLIHKPAVPSVSLTVAQHLDSVTCHYRFTPTNGLPPREDRVALVFSGDGVETFQLKHPSTGQLFATADTLSEYLLTPVFTGRPR